MTAIVKEEKSRIIQSEYDTTIIDIMDVSNFPMPAEMFISEKDIAW